MILYTIIHGCVVIIAVLVVVVSIQRFKSTSLQELIDCKTRITLVYIKAKSMLYILTSKRAFKFVNEKGPFSSALSRRCCVSWSP